MAEINADQIAQNIIPFEVDPEPGVQASQRAYAAQQVIVEGSQGLDPFEALRGRIEAGVDLSQAWAEQLPKDRLNILDQKREILGPESIQEEAIKAQNDIAGLNGGLGPYRQKVLSMPGSVNMTKEQVDEMAVSMMVQAEMADILEPVSDWGTAKYLAEMTFVPMLKSKTVAEVAENLGFTEDSTANFIGNLVDPGDLLVRMSSAAQSLSPEDKATFITQLKGALDEVEDNPFIKSEILSNVLTQDFNKIMENTWNSLEVAEVLTMGASAAKAGVKMAKGASMVNALKETLDEGLLNTAIKASKLPPNLAKTAQISKAELADAFNPTVSGDIAKLVSGSSKEVATELQHMFESQQAYLDALNKAAIKEGVLDKRRQDEIIKGVELELRQRPGVGNVSVTRDELGFSINYDEQVVDELGNVSVTKQQTSRTFTLDDAGELKVDDTEYGNIGLDPNAKLRGWLREQFVTVPERITHEQGKTVAALEGMLKEAFKPINGKGKAARDRIERVLQVGSKEGKEYSFHELTQVGVGAERLRLTKDEAKTYLGMRNVIDNLYHLENKRLQTEYAANGLKVVDLGEGVGTGARVFDDAEAAKRNFGRIASDSHYINVMDEGLENYAPNGIIPIEAPGQLTRDMVDDWYSKGFRLVRSASDSALFKKGDNKTQWALVREGSVKSPNDVNLLSRIPGYVPRSRTNSFYFIKQAGEMGITGGKGSIRTTRAVAWADNKIDAEKYIASLDDPDAYEIVFDGDMSGFDRASDIALTRGRMFTGKRKEGDVEEALRYVGSDDTFSYESSLETLQRYVNHVSKHLPASLYRLGSEKRLMQIAESFGVERATFQSVVTDAERVFGTTDKRYKLIKQLHDQISFINNIPTAEELAWGKRFENLGNALEPIQKKTKLPGLKPLYRAAYNGASKNFNPFDALRRVTFTSMLGMYNPAQILVQSSGAVAAYAINPVHALKATPKMIGWGTLDAFAHDPVAQRKVIQSMRNKGMEDYADSYEVWHKTGFRESIVSSNADFATIMGNKPYDAGVLQRVMANNDFFYRQGELAMSRAAVATAVEWYKKTNNVKKLNVDDPDVLKAITERAEKYRLNMGRANQSDMNKGWKAVPLQFQQVIAKYFEKVLPQSMGGTDELTVGEKLRLFSIPTAAFGAAGVPAGEFLYSTFLQTFGIEPTELSEDEAVLLKRGIAGWLAKDGMDMNIDFSTRMSLGDDFIKKAYDLVVNSGDLSSLFGPSGTTIDKVVENSQYVWKALSLYGAAEDYEMSADDAVAAMQILLDATADLATGPRNIKNYAKYVMQENPAFKRNGIYVYTPETWNKQTALMVAFGFQHDELVDLYTLKGELQDSASSYQKFGTTTEKTIARILENNILGTDVMYEKQVAAKMINGLIHSYAPTEQAKIMDNVFNLINDPQIDQYQLVGDYFLKMSEQMEEGLQFINPTLSRKLEGK